MILLLDIGNTRIKWRVLDAEKHAAVAEGNFGHKPEILAHLLQQYPDTQRIFGANVAGMALADDIARQAAPFGLKPEWAIPVANCAGVLNLYTDPTRLGADRWAALIGARHIHNGACLVVVTGTATTMDLLDAEGRFLGGAIIPGIDLMHQLLHRNTARLPVAKGTYSEMPRNTDDAIYSGILHAQLGAIERMFARIKTDPSAVCLLSGGAANHLSGLLDLPVLCVDNLVLEGLETLIKTQNVAGCV